MSETVGKKESAPKLRFPKFRGEWAYAPISHVLTEHSLHSDGNAQVHSVSVHKGVINQIEHLGRSFAAADTSRYNLARPGDVIYTKSPTGAFPYGIVKQSRLEENALISPLYGVFEPINRGVGYILDAHFESPIRANAFLYPLVQKGAKNTLQITNSRFLEGKIFLPRDRSEQLKIAGCLKSLDELIAAETEKLEAVKRHRKGLLQQLFPAEGETTPRLRFPQFRNSGDWRISALGDVCETSSGGTPPRSQKNYWNGTIPWVTTSLIDGNRITTTDEFITEQAMSKSAAKLFPPETVVIAMIGQGKTRGKVAVLGIAATTNQNCAAILPSRNIRSQFLFFQLFGAYERFRSLSNGGGQSSLSQTLIAQFEIAVPPDIAEQETIAGTLNHVAQMCVQQEYAVSQLRTHKAALMQQLFPTMDEI